MKKTLLFDAKTRVALCSDVHLDNEPSELTEHFQRELTKISEQVDVVILLGDIFHYWLGDSCVQRYKQTMATLKTISTRCDVYFMPGNRDFLLGSGALSPFGIGLLSDPCVMTLGNQRILLSHGDRYCTLDTSYQRLRIVLQHPLTKWLACVVPYSLRLNIAHYLRAQSRLRGPSKSPTTMDIYLPTLQQAMHALQCSVAIYGHVHYLRDRELDDNKTLRCITLDSWQNQTNFCVVKSDDIRLITF